MLASDLQRMLQLSHEDIEVERRKNSATTLDLGSIIVAIAGAPFLAELCKGLTAWMLKHPSASLTLVRGAEGERIELSAAGLTANQVAALVKEVLQRS
ncbi:hypothetical protein [Achromobacter animicus]|uniref:hypothetical protein n=1 Tax=Achromobacter animicus TaxID=1389935 RepID=UPI0028AA40DF|nr:hypothetical protein [Achromobacter animicus]